MVAAVCPRRTRREQSLATQASVSALDPKVHRAVAICLTGLLFSFFPDGTAFADTREASFTVSVTVPVLASISILEAPNPMLLSEEDVSRGHKMVSVRYRVNCNATGGYLLQFTPRIGLAHTIEIEGLGSNVTVQHEAVEVRRPPVAEAVEVALQLKLLLEPSVAPGRHKLPLHVTAVPL